MKGSRPHAMNALSILAALASCKQERGLGAARIAINMVAGVLTLVQQIIPQMEGGNAILLAGVFTLMQGDIIIGSRRG